MRRRVLTAALAVAASLSLASAARADTYQVTTTGDEQTPGSCQLVQPTIHTCTLLRDALNEAQSGDQVYLQAPGTYQLLDSTLYILRDIAVFGLGPGQTTIRPSFDFQVLTVGDGANASLANLTIADGSSETGGNIYVEGGSKLTLTAVRVTGGKATYGAGVANFGRLTVFASLFDGNVADGGGGAIYSYGEAPDSGVTLADSTLASNTAPDGAALYTLGAALGTVDVVHSTIARNTGDAITFSSPGPTTSVYGSLIGPNSGANCAGGTFGSASFSIESANTCGLDRPNTDAQLATALSNPGGPTSVLTIPPTSPAVDFVNPCASTTDQQLQPRGTPACDAGAYEAVVPVAPTPTPTPTPVPPTPTATPTPSPTPVAGKSVGAETVTGRVLVRRPGSKRFVALDEGVLPNGTEVDARKGTVEIERSDGGHATFRGGIFRVSQASGLTTLALTQKLSCAKRKRGAASAAAKKVKTRRLFASGKGKFRTKGQYGAATVRGTKWTTTDTCASTTVKVTQGVVSFRDLVKRSNRVVRKGHSATARARR